MSKFFCLTSQMGVPIGAPLKHIAPEVGAALVSGGASLVNSIFGTSSQDKANKTNLKIAQMNNDFNREMFEKQIAYNWDMWQANTEYNSAKSQVQRFRDAGINPYLAMNGNNAGVAQSSGGITPPTAQNVQVQPSYRPFSAEGLVNALLQKKQIELTTKKQEAEIRNLDAQTFRSESLLGYDIDMMYENLVGKRNENFASKLRNEILPDMLGLEKRKLAAETAQAETGIDIQKAELDGKLIANRLASIDERWRNDQLIADLAVTKQTLERLIAETKVSYATIENICAQTLKVGAETYGIRVNNGILNRSAQFLINKNEYESIRAKNNQGSDNEYQFWNHFNDDYFGKKLFDSTMGILKGLPNSVLKLFKGKAAKFFK